MAAADAHAHEDHSTRPYLMVFLALIVLTVVTVGLSYIDLGYVGNKVLGLAVATGKAALVVAIFMHMKHDGARDKYLLVAVFFPLSLFVLLVMANFPDIVYRGGDESRRFAPGPYDKTHVDAPKDGHGGGSHEGHKH